MQKYHRLKLALLLGLSTMVPSASIAQNKNGYGDSPRMRISSLYRCTAPTKMVDLDLLRALVVLGESDAYSKLTYAIAEIKKCQDDLLPPAIAAAGNKADLKQAIKQYHLKDAGYVDSMTDSKLVHERAERERNDAQNALNMEMNLAGIQ